MIEDSSLPEELRGAIPMLVVRGVGEAMAFYERAFGAEEADRLAGPGGKIVHGEIRVGGARVMLSEESPPHSRSPQTLGGSGVIVQVYVADVDALFARAVEAGAKVIFPLSDQFYGDRSGRLEDPFGHLWIFSARKETLTGEEIQRRFEAMMKQG